MISPALKEFKPRSEKPSEGCSKKRVEGDGTPACSLVGPGSTLIPAQEAWGHPRICVARPLSQAGLVNQAAALAGPVRLPLVSSPRGDPRLCSLRVPPPPTPPPAAVSLFSDVTQRPRPATPIQERAPARPSPLREASSPPPASLPWPRPGSPEGDAGDTLQGAAAVAVGQPERTVDGRGTPPRPTSRSSPKSSDKSKSFSIDSILARRQGQKPAGGGELLGVAKQGPGGCLGASLLATSSSLHPPFNASLMLDPHVQGGFYQLGIPFLSYFPLQLPEAVLHFQ